MDKIHIVIKESDVIVSPPYHSTIIYRSFFFLHDEILLLQKYANGGNLLVGPLHSQWIDTTAHKALVEKGVVQLTKESTDTSKKYEASPLGRLVIARLVEKSQLVIIPQ